jgi:leucyl-tRNA synthetase
MSAKDKKRSAIKPARPGRYDFQKAEKKWRAVWQKEGVYEPKLKGASAGKRAPFYNLMMFPYPSAEGLHVGNMYAFTGSDVYGRFMRMQGKDVFEPIGLDGFGIHSENYAMKVGTHPAKQAAISEKRFYEQLQSIGNGFAWKERVETYDPEYYKWTQWIFTKLFKAGLAYRKKQAVNWCPKDQTVLADEQVEGGKCERCGAVAEKRELEQWFFRITKYAEQLLQNTDKLDWTEKVRIAQRNWIGKSEGADIDFKLSGSADSIKVFTTRPDTIFGATYLVLAPEHPFLSLGIDKGIIKNGKEVSEYMQAAKARSDEDRLAEGKDKTGVEIKGFKAVNPATGEEIPVWVADYVLGGYGTGAIMAVPAHDERDADFAKNHDLPVRVVVKEDDGLLIHSDSFNGLTTNVAKERIVAWLAESGTAEARTQYRLRDWLISRQRYWGPPIPMVFCEKCAASGKGERKDMPGWYAVADKNLPVKLPMVKDFRPQGTGKSPLASVKSFYETKCPACKSKARRETDVSDTFLDSAWYYLRYPSAGEKKRAWDPAVIKKFFPVDMYIGGAEHSVLHLLYVRFLALALHDMKLLNFPERGVAPEGEPFPTFRAHGLIIKEGAKMSKSKGNVVNPDEYIRKFGADTLRMYLMFLAPFEQGGDFRDQAVPGISRFLERVLRFMGSSENTRTKAADGEKKIIHLAVKKVGEDLATLHYNTAISALMICLNGLEELGGATKETKEMFVKLLAPLAPYLSEELWRGVLGHKKTVHKEAWPKYEKDQIVEKNMILIVQVNGKTRATIETAADITEAKARELALSDAKIQAALGGQDPKRVIYVPGRLVNIVV